METAASVLAAAAIGHIGGGVRLATVGGNAVTILETTRARSHLARAANARTYGIGGRAFGPACAAIVDIRIQINFAAVGSDAVAVRKTRVASANAADTRVAHRSGVRNLKIAIVATASAVIRITIRVSFATIGGVAVTIGERRCAGGNAADSGFAGGSAISFIWADVTASGAIVHADIQVHFATIGCIGVAIGKALGTGDAAFPAAAGRRAVGGAAGGAATTAITGVGLKIHFATIGGVTVAIRIAWITTGNRATAAGAAGSGIRKITSLAAAAAIIDIRRCGRFAAIGWIAVAIRKTRAASWRTHWRRTGANRAAMVIGALGTAGPAVVNVAAQRCFATVIDVIVAVSEA